MPLRAQRGLLTSPIFFYAFEIAHPKSPKSRPPKKAIAIFLVLVGHRGQVNTEQIQVCCLEMQLDSLVFCLPTFAVGEKRIGDLELDQP